jgi:hypothetical protein
MLKYFKPTRGNGIHQRGYFSYITEAVVHIHNVLLNYPDKKLKNDEESIKKHIQEIVFGTYVLGMTKKLFCTKLNLSAFSIFLNSKLNYTRLN